MGDILKIHLCVTKIMGRLNVTAQYFFCSLDFFLLIFRSDQDVKRLSGSTNKDGGSDDCLLKQDFKATELFPNGFKLLLFTVNFFTVSE